MNQPHQPDRQTGVGHDAALDRMSLAQIYRHEVLQSRRDRSRRAFFWARIFGLALMLTIGAALRSEPDLRNSLARAGMDAIMMVSDRKNPTQTAALKPAAPSLPRDRIKVNRFGNSHAKPNQEMDVQAIASEVGRTMAAQKYTN